MTSKLLIHQHQDRPPWYISPSDITDRSASPIGRGGFGGVFTGSYFGTQVAIKQLLGAPNDPELASYHHEIEVWQNLSHPHVLPLLGACDKGDAGEKITPFMVSPFMPNGTLRDYVANNNISLEKKLSLLYQVAAALAYLHARSIIHGDLKAANVLLDKSFQAIVTDFGLSRTKHTSASMNPNRNGGSTSGTEGYMAPEMLDDENPTGTTMMTDVYAFAITMYEVLNNADPVWVSNDGQAMKGEAIRGLVCNGQRPSRFDGIPDDIWLLVEQCWHQDPSMRPTFGDIASILAPFEDVTSFPIPADTASSASPRRLESPTLAQRLTTGYGLPRAVIMGIQRGDADAHITAAHTVSDGKPANDPAWTTAAELYQAAADKGSVEAASELAWLHFTGIGITKSDTEAFAYWQVVHNKAKDATMKPIATFMMGWCCYLGRGTRQDEPRANQLLRESKTAEFPYGESSIHGLETQCSSSTAARFFGLCQLGTEHDWFCKHLAARCLIGGFGADKDPQLAVRLLQVLADQGHAISQYAFADCYLGGLGVPQDDAKAVELYRRGAAQGHLWSILNVGLRYANSQGVTQDDDQAVEWYRRAAEMGMAAAQNQLGFSYYNGKGITQDYAQAFEWYTKAANQGHTDAQCNLGSCYYHGHGAVQDYAKAVEWFTKSADQGNVWGQCNLGNCFYHGHGVVQDHAKAVEWLTKAANQGNAIAQTGLGNCYRDGEGVIQDYTKAVEWFTRAADQGNAVAQNNLGNCYYKGEGVAQDYAKTLEWFTKAANQGNAVAQNNLGNFYHNGRGVTKSIETARHWYRKAADQGNITAQNNLAKLGGGCNIQ